jgi:hypothetical protein
MDLGLELPDVLGFAATWVYAFWPVLVLAPLAAGGSRRKSPIPAMLTAWGLAALAGIVSTVMNIPKISLIP